VELNCNVGFICAARHGVNKSPLFEFVFELDEPHMNSKGYGANVEFRFVVDFSTGHAKLLTSCSEPGILKAARIHPEQMEDFCLGFERVLKWDGSGEGESIYECRSFEYVEPQDTSLREFEDDIGQVFFSICDTVLTHVKQNSGK
jgi:hypothetical protein